MIVGPTPAQMDDFCDLHGTPDTPVSRIVTVKVDGITVLSQDFTKEIKIIHRFCFFLAISMYCQARSSQIKPVQ